MGRLLLVAFVLLVGGVLTVASMYLWKRWQRPTPPDGQYLQWAVEAPSGAVPAGSPFEVMVEVRRGPDTQARGAPFCLEIARESLRSLTLLSARPAPLRQEPRRDWEALFYRELAPMQTSRWVLRFRPTRVGKCELQLRLSSPEGVHHGLVAVPVPVKAAAPGRARLRPVTAAHPVHVRSAWDTGLRSTGGRPYAGEARALSR